MNKSDSIANLAAALCKAQSQIKPALKESTNPFFKSKYADFSSVLDACEDALLDNGLAVVQAPISDEHGAGVETMLLHTSGEYLSERLILPAVKDDPQGLGSCITYARRYALEGFLRIRREDDDGNAAVQSLKDRRAAEGELKKQADRQKQEQADAKRVGMAIMDAAAQKGVEALALAWQTLTSAQRKACAEEKEAFKAQAQLVDASRKEPVNAE